MERKNIHWLTVLIVTAFAICGGFVAGSMLGIRERGTLKTRNAALAQSESKSRERLSEVEIKNRELSAELDQAGTDIAHWRAECERLEILAEFHPPMVLDIDPFDAESRIVELECEVASLKELANQNRVKPVDGRPSSTVRSEVAIAKAVDAPVSKEQCSSITKKGVRCSRVARSHGKCWQHGG